VLVVIDRTDIKILIDVQFSTKLLLLQLV